MKTKTETLTEHQAKPKVAILMATYNGAKFICEQIESILKQQDVEVCFYTIYYRFFCVIFLSSKSRGL